MLGIVLLNFNTPDDVFSCINSIREKTSLKYKIYLVDNCSTDNSYDLFNDWYLKDDDITLIKSQRNDGFSAGNNLGIAKALEDKCEYICIINPDIILLNDSMSILCDSLRADTSVYVAAPSIKSPDNDIEGQFARVRLTYKNFLTEKTILKKFKRYSKKNPRYLMVNTKFNEEYKFFGMTYGCMYILKREFFELTGLLDEDVFLFNEEDIIAHKLFYINKYTLINPKASVLHNHHNSIKKTSVANRVYNFQVSELITLRKYADASKIQLFPIMLFFRIKWFFKSLKYDDFKEMRKKFKKKLNQILKIKKNIGFKNIVGNSNE